MTWRGCWLSPTGSPRITVTRAIALPGPICLRQEVTGGGLTITVLEGRYGAVRTFGRGKLWPDLRPAFLKTLKPGDVIAQSPLERATLVLGDLLRHHGLPGAPAGIGARHRLILMLPCPASKRWDGSFSLQTITATALPAATAGGSSWH